MNKLSIAVPVYNEEKTIEKILTKVLALPIDDYEVLVINDASSDGSLEIINRLEKAHKNKKCKLVVFNHKTNKGKGAGIKTALTQANGLYFVVQDADLEYDPNDIVKLLNSAIDNNYEVVYGSRFLGKIHDMPKPNYYANRLYNFMIRRLYGIKITDMHTCFKMVKTKTMQEIKMQSDGFNYATELISKLLKKGVVINEVPIVYHGRAKKDGKKISYKDGLSCMYDIVVYKFPKEDMMALYSKHRVMTSRFVVVGTVGFITNYTFLAILTGANLNHILSEILATIIALQVTFVLHDNWTYRPHGHIEHHHKFRIRYFSYLTSNSFGSLMTVVVFAFFSIFFGYFIALALASSAAIVWNFLMNQKVIWRID